MTFEYCEDLKSFFSIRTDPVHYNHWSLKGLGCDTDLQSLPVIYTGKRKYFLSRYFPLERFITRECRNHLCLMALFENLIEIKLMT